MNYSRNRKYFKPTSIKPAIILIVIALIFFSINLIIALLLLAAGAALIYFQIKGKPTDEEIDEICNNEIKNAVSKGLNKLGLDEEQVKLIDPIVINGPFYEKIARGYLWKRGKDGRLRSSNFEVATLFFGENQVFLYNFRFSLIENERNEGTDEYFYKDIVSVATSSDTLTFKDENTGKEETYNIERFKLTTSGGTSMKCSVWDLGGTERSIQGMKQLLRDKKSA